MKQTLHFPNLSPEKATSALNRIVWFDGLENTTNPSSILREFHAFVVPAVYADGNLRNLSMEGSVETGTAVDAIGKMSNTVAIGLFLCLIPISAGFAISSTVGYASVFLSFVILVLAPWFLWKKKLSVISNALSTAEFVNDEESIWFADQGMFGWVEWWLGLFLIPLILIGIGYVMDNEFTIAEEYHGILANAFIAGLVLLVIVTPIVLILNSIFQTISYLIPSWLIPQTDNDNVEEE